MQQPGVRAAIWTVKDQNSSTLSDLGTDPVSPSGKTCDVATMLQVFCGKVFSVFPVGNTPHGTDQRNGAQAVPQGALISQHRSLCGSVNNRHRKSGTASKEDAERHDVLELLHSVTSSEGDSTTSPGSLLHGPKALLLRKFFPEIS